MATVHRMQTISLTESDVRDAIMDWVSYNNLEGDFAMDPSTVQIHTEYGIACSGFTATIKSPKEQT